MDRLGADRQPGQVDLLRRPPAGGARHPGPACGRVATGWLPQVARSVGRGRRLCVRGRRPGLRARGLVPLRPGHAFLDPLIGDLGRGSLVQHLVAGLVALAPRVPQALLEPPLLLHRLDVVGGEVGIGLAVPGELVVQARLDLVHPRANLVERPRGEVDLPLALDDRRLALHLAARVVGPHLLGQAVVDAVEALRDLRHVLALRQQLGIIRLAPLPGRCELAVDGLELLLPRRPLVEVGRALLRFGAEQAVVQRRRARVPPSGEQRDERDQDGGVAPARQISALRSRCHSRST